MKISYVIAFVSDLEKARKFYTEKLGLSVTEEIPDEQSLTFDIENVKFGVHVPSEKNRHNIGKSTGILFYVDDVKIDGNLIKPHRDGKTHQVRVVMG